MRSSPGACSENTTAISRRTCWRTLTTPRAACCSTARRTTSPRSCLVCLYACLPAYPPQCLCQSIPSVRVNVYACLSVHSFAHLSVGMFSINVCLGVTAEPRPSESVYPSISPAGDAGSSDGFDPALLSLPSPPSSPIRPVPAGLSTAASAPPMPLPDDLYPTVPPADAPGPDLQTDRPTHLTTAVVSPQSQQQVHLPTALASPPTST
jgi:hypothetical protein